MEMSLHHLRQKLLSWYDQHRRELPWRPSPSPYATLVSEFMLQQTQVKTVIPYYEAFLRRFPDIESLARASEEEVLQLWQGLGYYRRARYLHQAAREIVKHHEGEIPIHDVKALRRLPGIGPYMAGALASIAGGKAVPALDGNARRVWRRLLGKDDPRLLKAMAQKAVDPLRPGDFNQALMDLGNLICRPKKPLCPACPLWEICRTRGEGNQPSPRKPPRPVSRPTLILRRQNEVFLEKRPAEGLLGGLYGFPALPPGFPARRLPRWDYRHTFSHRVWEVKVYEALAGETGISLEGQYVPLQPDPPLPLPRAFRPLWEKLWEEAAEEKDDESPEDEG
ncbi:MAG: A/G-specific adenine glycosylase [Clostridiales bacterium]|nr:A/G-specific adenine glycosylase [Clostridiales bacterium]